MLLKPYYQTKLGKLYHGDCLYILPKLDVKVDLVLTDPPWNMNYFVNDNDEWGEYCLKLESWVRTLSFFCENMIVFQSSKSISYTSNLFCGWFPFVSVKNFSQMTKTSLPNCFDIAYIKNNLFYNSTGRNWFLSNTAGMLKERTDHPTPRSLDVVCYLISIFNASSFLDPFLGSGTTAVACEQLNRRWIGIEISEKYCEIAAKRIEQESKRSSMRLSNKKTKSSMKKLRKSK